MVHKPRVIMYYQTITSLKPILISPNPITHIHASSIHFGMDTQNKPYIHFNDLSPYNYTFDTVWNELEQASKLGIKVKLMVGGAGGGYSTLFSNYTLFYGYLAELLRKKPFISGIDLDIEESVSLENVKMLIRSLKTDFGGGLTLSMAPIQSSLEVDEPGIGGFIYKDLLKSPEGTFIDYLNVQFYSDFSYDAYEKIIANGYLPEMIVMGALAGTNNDTELGKVVEQYKQCFGGVFVWEYCFAKPSPLGWANNMWIIINGNISNGTYSDKVEAECPRLFSFFTNWKKN
jgi:hypothetical protein